MLADWTSDELVVAERAVATAAHQTSAGFRVAASSSLAAVVAGRRRVPLEIRWSAAVATVVVVAATRRLVDLTDRPADRLAASRARLPHFS